MIELKMSRVRLVAGEVVDRAGYDFRYIAEGNTEPVQWQTCRNWHDNNGEPVAGCIVGTIMHELGIPFSMMPKFGDSGSLLSSLWQEGVISFSDKENEKEIRSFLRIMQVAQDNGATWHSAYRTAIHVLGSIGA